MAQTLKPEIASRILSAAEHVFAECGYEKATMAAIAERADLSTGNAYRYFAGKDALFDALISDDFAAELLKLVRQRVESLARAPSLTALDAAAQADAEALLQFFCAQRLRVITLLDRAAGSRHAGFQERFIQSLLGPTRARLKADLGAARLPDTVETVLHSVFRNTVQSLVHILAAYADEAKIREAFSAFWSYQLAGLAGFTRWVNHELSR